MGNAERLFRLLEMSKFSWDQQILNELPISLILHFSRKRSKISCCAKPPQECQPTSFYHKYLCSSKFLKPLILGNFPFIAGRNWKIFFHHLLCGYWQFMAWVNMPYFTFYWHFYAQFFFLSVNLSKQTLTLMNVKQKCFLHAKLFFTAPS